MSDKEMKNLSDYYVKKKQGANNSDGFLKVDEHGEVYVATGIVIPDDVEIDNELNNTSTRAVQNKVIYTALSNKIDKAQGPERTKKNLETDESGNIDFIARDNTDAYSIEMDGVASKGDSTSFARGNHVHPHDDTKIDKTDTTIIKKDNINYGNNIQFTHLKGNKNDIRIHKIGNICIANIYIDINESSPTEKNVPLIITNMIREDFIPPNNVGHIVKSAGDNSDFFYLYLAGNNNNASTKGRFYVRPYRSNIGGIVTTTMCWFCGG